MTLDPCRQSAPLIYISLVGEVRGKGKPPALVIERFLAGESEVNFLRGECSVATILDTIKDVMDGSLVEYYWRSFSISRLKVGPKYIETVALIRPIVGSLARLLQSYYPSPPITVKEYEPWPEKFQPNEERPPWSIQDGMVIVADF